MYRLRAKKKIKKPFILSFNYKDKMDQRWIKIRIMVSISVRFRARVQGLVLRSEIKIRINVRV